MVPFRFGLAAFLTAARGWIPWRAQVVGLRAGWSWWVGAISVAGAGSSEAALNTWLGAQTNLVTWQAEFTQTRELSTLTRPLTAQGRVWFAAPNRFRWELGDPPQTIAARQPGEILIVYPRLKRAERYPLDASTLGPWKEAMALLDAGFPRSRAELDAAFEVLSVTETNRLCQVAMRPRSPAARKLMPEIQLTFSPESQQLSSTRMRFMDGSVLRNEFMQVRTNVPLEAALFQPVVGPDFQLSEPARKGGR